mgnify:CR=1 FL=1
MANYQIEPNTIYDAEGVAKALNISKNLVSTLVRDGRLPKENKIGDS